MATVTVYPQGTTGAYGTQTALYAQALQNQKSQDSLQLQYSNALWQEKLKNQQLTDQVQYQPYQYAAQLGAYGLGGYGGYGLNSLGLGTGMLGANALGVVPTAGTAAYLPTLATGYGGLPMSLSGSGQTNSTNQVGAAGSSQSVSNANTYNMYSMAGLENGWGNVENMLGGIFNGGFGSWL